MNVIFNLIKDASCLEILDYQLYCKSKMSSVFLKNDMSQHYKNLNTLNLSNKDEVVFSKYSRIYSEYFEFSVKI